MRSLSLLRLAVRLRRSPRLVVALCAAGVCGAGLIDVAAPRDLSMGFFFVAPILLAVGFVGRGAGVAVCLVAGVFEFWDLWMNARDLSQWWALWGALDWLGQLLLPALLVDALLARARHNGRLLVRERRYLKAKGEMISLVSHEVANAMTMIDLAVRELEAPAEVAGADPVSREELYGIVKRNVSRMSLISRNFLSEARLTSGRFKLQLVPERLDDLVGQVVASLRPLADGKEIALSWRVLPRDLRAMVDRDALAVALANLIGNAIKYTPERGLVAVDIRLLEDDTRLVRVRVEDDGIGMTAEEQQRVLAAFERTETGRKAASGFGLGLKLAYDMVKAHGSALSIASAPGRGSRFSFLLPSHREPQAGEVLLKSL